MRKNKAEQQLNDQQKSTINKNHKKFTTKDSIISIHPPLLLARLLENDVRLVTQQLQFLLNHFDSEEVEMVLVMVVALAHKEDINIDITGIRQLFPHLHLPCQMHETTSNGFSIFHAFALLYCRGEGMSLVKAIQSARTTLMVTSGSGLLIDKEGKSSMYVAFKAGLLEAAFLMYKHLPIDLFQDLYCAYLNQDHAYIRYLKELGITMDTAIDVNGNTLLHQACQRDDEALIRRLLAVGHFPVPRNHVGETPSQLLPRHSTVDRALFEQAFVVDDAKYNDDLLLQALVNKDIEKISTSAPADFHFHHYVYAYYFARNDVLIACMQKFRSYEHLAKLAWFASHQSNFYVLRRMQKTGVLAHLIKQEQTRALLSKESFLSLCLVELMAVTYHFEYDTERLIREKYFVLKALALADIHCPAIATLQQTYNELVLQHLKNSLCQLDKKHPGGKIKQFLLSFLGEKSHLCEMSPQDFFILFKTSPESETVTLLLFANLAQIRPKAFQFLLQCFMFNEDLDFFNAFIRVAPSFFTFKTCELIIEKSIQCNQLLNLNLIIRVLHLMNNFPQWKHGSNTAQKLFNMLDKKHMDPACTELDRERTFFLYTVLMGLGAMSTSSGNEASIIWQVSHNSSTPLERVEKMKAYWLSFERGALEDLFDCGPAYLEYHKTTPTEITEMYAHASDPASINHVIYYCGNPFEVEPLEKQDSEDFITIRNTCKTIHCLTKPPVLTLFESACSACRRVFLNVITAPMDFDTRYHTLLLMKRRSKPTSDVTAMEIDSPVKPSYTTSSHVLFQASHALSHSQAPEKIAYAQIA